MGDNGDYKLMTSSFVQGLVAVPAFIGAAGNKETNHFASMSALYAAAVFSITLSTFLDSFIHDRNLLQSTQDAIWSIPTSVLGGLMPYLMGVGVVEPLDRISTQVAVSASIMALGALYLFSHRRDRNQNPIAWHYFLVWIIAILGIAITAGFNDLVNHLTN